MREKVSILLPVQEAMDQMDLRETNDRPVFVNWAINADKRIKAPKSYQINHAVLTVDNCTADLPCGVLSVHHVLLGQCSSPETQFPSLVPSDVLRFQAGAGLIVVDSSASFNVDNSVRWSVQNNKIVLNSSAWHGKKITVKLRQYILDCDGFPMVDAEHVEAIAQFILWMYAKRSRFKRKNKMTEWDIEKQEKEWDRLCADARGMSGDPEGDKNAIVEMWNDPLSGHGIQSPFDPFNYF